MSDSYLWDASGPPDGDVARLERALTPLRLRSSGAAALVRAQSHQRWLRRASIATASAAAVLLLSLGGWWGWRYATAPRIDVTRSSGAARIDGALLADRVVVRADRWIETDATGGVRIDLPAIGRIDAGAATRVALRWPQDQETRLTLARGVLDVDVKVEPRRLVIETPAGEVTDLGCRFRVRVAADDVVTVSVSEGAVELAGGGRVAFVAKSMSCVAQPGRGARAPLLDDAPAELAAAVARLFAEPLDLAALPAVLANARERDGLTLWHVLRWTPPDVRPRVYERLIELVPPPNDIRVEDVLELNEYAIECWRKRLQSRL
ncbi:MAG: FecR family protein [Phycisphaerae bacterium]